MNQSNLIDSIDSKEDFAKFVMHLKSELLSNSEAWENTSLDTFLEAMAGFTQDLDGYALNNEQASPQNIPWKGFASILMSARTYE